MLYIGCVASLWFHVSRINHFIQLLSLICLLSLDVCYVCCSFSMCAENIHVAVIEMVSLFPQVHGLHVCCILFQ